MPAEQNFANHTRFHPAFHFLLAPIFLINVFVSLWSGWKSFAVHPFAAIWGVVVAVGLLGLLTLARTYALKVQDRVIRLEERLRLASLPAAVPGQLPELTARQLIALRFASDAEASGLASRAVVEQLTPRQIKESVRVWRADHHRV